MARNLLRRETRGRRVYRFHPMHHPARSRLLCNVRAHKVVHSKEWHQSSYTKMQESKFRKRVEDFKCEHCGEAVKGNGYTNHCPHCLWSKHVDVNPGDRLSGCGGMMEPIALEGTVARLRILHRCQLCGLEKRNDAAPDDDKEKIVSLAGKRAILK